MRGSRANRSKISIDLRQVRFRLFDSFCVLNKNTFERLSLCGTFPLTILAMFVRKRLTGFKMCTLVAFTDILCEAIFQINFFLESPRYKFLVRILLNIHRFPES